ncbi:hypothetical protein [Varibaculum cambriense]|nr:hypothetical protein [Varibaculum cambriense]
MVSVQDDTNIERDSAVNPKLVGAQHFSHPLIVSSRQLFEIGG